jgi:hypothetical protein
MEYKIESPERDSEVQPTEGSAHPPLVSDAPPSYSHVIREKKLMRTLIRELEKKDRAAPNVVSIQPMANSQV